MPECIQCDHIFMFTDLSNCYWKTYSPRPSHKFSKKKTKKKIHESAKQIHQWRNTIANFLPAHYELWPNAYFEHNFHFCCSVQQTDGVYRILQSATVTLANFRNFHGHVFFLRVNWSARATRPWQGMRRGLTRAQRMLSEEFSVVAVLFSLNCCSSRGSTPPKGRHLAGRGARKWMLCILCSLQELRMQRCSILNLVKLITFNTSGIFGFWCMHWVCCG